MKHRYQKLCSATLSLQCQHQRKDARKGPRYVVMLMLLCCYYVIISGCSHCKHDALLCPYVASVNWAEVKRYTAIFSPQLPASEIHSTD